MPQGAEGRKGRADAAEGPKGHEASRIFRSTNSGSRVQYSRTIRTTASMSWSLSILFSCEGLPFFFFLGAQRPRCGASKAGKDLGETKKKRALFVFLYMKKGDSPS